MISLLETEILSLTWQSENAKERMDMLEREWFENPKLYDKVKSYIDSGHSNDPVEAMQIMGIDTYKELTETVTHGGDFGRWDKYYTMIRAAAVSRDITFKAASGEITADDCRKAIPLLERNVIDEKEYDMNNNLHDYTADLEKRIVKDFEHYNTGIKEIDDTCGMILPGEFIVLSGDSGLGKTTFALKIFNYLIQRNTPCLFISSEMGYFSLIDKMVALNSGLNAKLIRNGLVSREQMSKIVDVVGGKLANKPGVIVETGLLDIPSITKKALKHNAKFVIIDYIQQFSVDNLRGMNKADFVEEIAKKLKALAIDNNLIVIGLSQLNAGGEVKSSRAIREKCDMHIKLELKEDGQILKKINLIIEKSRYSETKIFGYIMDKTTGDFHAENMNNDY